LNPRVLREFINVFDNEPQKWSQLVERIHKAISKRVVHWWVIHAERAELAATVTPVDAAFWRTLRQDFGSLQAYKFDLFWSENHWSWMDFPDESLKVRLSAFALRGARALGYDSEDSWYGELRRSGFVRSNMIGRRPSEGAIVDSNWGPICDVVKESITLCYTLEAAVVSTESLAGGSVATTASPNWQEIRDKFLQGAAAYPDLLAHWDSRDKLWTLRDGSQESDRLFKEAASRPP
jgi:hypothetical protein